MSKILIIAPEFHQYHKFVQTAAGAIFDDVTFLPEFPRSRIFKLTKRIPFLKKLHMKFHLLNLRDLTKFDKILCIRCHYWEERDVDMLKHSNVTYYNWDSIENNRSALTFARKGISVATFDKKDSIKYGFRYIPLFHSENYGKRHHSSKSNDYDFCMICSGHSDRISIAKRLMKLDLKSYIHVYLPIMVQIKFLFKKKLDTDVLAITTAKSLSDARVASIMSRSKVAVDFAHPKQFGATSRTIEALASGTFLLTNNPGSLEFAIAHNLEKNVELYTSLDDLFEKLQRLIDVGVSFTGEPLRRTTEIWLQEILSG